RRGSESGLGPPTGDVDVLNREIGAALDVVAERGRKLEKTSERQQLVAERLVVPQGGGGAAEAKRALLQHVDAVGERQRELDVLLGEQDGQALALEPGDLLAQVIDDDRRQSLGRLVEQEQLGVAHQRARDR